MFKNSVLVLLTFLCSSLYGEGVLHRKGNPVIDEEEVADFYYALLEAGKECHLIIKEKTASDDALKLSYDEVLVETEAWVDGLM